MTFKEVLAHVIDWLQQDQRLSYRALKRQFAWMTTTWKTSRWS